MNHFSKVAVPLPAAEVPWFRWMHAAPIGTLLPLVVLMSWVLGHPPSNCGGLIGIQLGFQRSMLAGFGLLPQVRATLSRIA